jgi:hypothetical protein
MKKSRFTDEQLIGFLRQAEVKDVRIQQDRQPMLQRKK